MGFNIRNLFGGPELSFAGAAIGNSETSQSGSFMQRAKGLLVKHGFDEHCPTCGGPIDHCPTCGGPTHMHNMMGPGPMGGGGHMMHGGPMGGPPMGGGPGMMGGGGPRMGGGGSRRGLLIIILIVVVVLAAVGITLGVVLSKNNSDTTTGTTQAGYGKVCYFVLDGTSEVPVLSDAYKETTVEDGQYFHLEVCKLDGYTFLGYYDSTGVQYVNEYGVSNDEAKASDNLVLYPHHKANEYELEFDANGGLGLKSTSRDVTYGNTVEPLESKLIKEGYTFSGWYTTPEGEGLCVAYKNGVVVGDSLFTFSKFGKVADSAKTVTLYARYEIQTLSVNLQYADGTRVTKVVDYGTRVEDVFYPENEYTISASECTKFVGWSDSLSGGKLVDTITEDSNLYEIRTPVIYVSELGIKDSVNAGNVYTAPNGDNLEAPIGKVFDKWQDEISGKYFEAGDLIVMPSCGRILRAVFVEE